MRKTKKFAAVMAVALGVGLATSPVDARIVLKPNGVGDALLFPVFNGYIENYFTISNSSNEWVQGHLRFRGGAWSGELLDFDVVLTPGDVLVFRVADLDGDGLWEVDQSLDAETFRYSGIDQKCGMEQTDGTTPVKDRDLCMDQSSILIPKPEPRITADLIKYQRMTGYVEFIGEGVFREEDGVTGQIKVPSHQLMNKFTNPANAGKFGGQGQRQVDTRRGVSLWSWVDAANAKEVGNSGTYTGYFVTTSDPDAQQQVAPASDPTINGNAKVAGITYRTAADVPNVLSGTGFVALPGSGMGIAYNAEAFVDFRTTTPMDINRLVDLVDLDGDAVGPAIKHRIDNYPPDWAVILHDENSVGPRAGVSPRGDYVYGYTREGGSLAEDRFDESRISFNNTWGPTLADGDDYYTTNWLTCNFFNGACPNKGEVDNWDITLGNVLKATGYWDYANSIAEVEEAIREGGQVYTSFYFDRNLYQGASLRSWYFAFFPTKFFYAEDGTDWGRRPTLVKGGADSYLNAAVAWLLNLSKPVGIEVWNTEEIPLRTTIPDCPQSPCLPGSQASTSLGQELSFFDIGWMKGLFTDSTASSYAETFTRGRVVLFPLDNNPRLNAWSNASKSHPTWPFLAYTFDMEATESNVEIGHWRSMQRFFTAGAFICIGI